MSSGWHFWLFEGEEGRLPLPVEDIEPKVFTSLGDARKMASRVGRAVDIFRTPMQGGMAEFVERVETGGVKGRIESELPAMEQSAKGEVKPTETKLEARLNVVAPDAHVRKLVFHAPSVRGESWRVEAFDEKGNLLASGMGEPEDAYLEFWNEVKPPDE